MIAKNSATSRSFAVAVLWLYAPLFKPKRTIESTTPRSSSTTG